jgi:PAS domain S-box-containing protein
MNKPSLLIVEDEALVAADLAMRLKKLGYAVLGTAANGEDALALAAEVRPELVLMDIRLAGAMDGVETAIELRSRLHLPVVFLTAYADSDTLQHAKVAEPYGYIRKPFDLLDLHVGVEKALHKHQAERTLQASEERHRTILQTAMDGFWLVDRQGRLLEVNASYCRMSGYSVPELLAMHISDLDIDDTAADVAARIREAMVQGGIRFESRHRRKDGSIFEVEVSVQSQPVESGQIVVFLRDITRRKQAEAELKNLRTAVEQSENTIMITDTEGCIEYVNPAFEKSTGFTVAEVRGLNCRLLKSGKQSQSVYQELWTTIAAGQTWRGRLHNQRKDGTLYWESATISPVHDKQGKIVHFIAIKEDITKQKAMEARLTEALAQAELSAAAKSEFLSVMSHELRTPLNGVLGLAELLSCTPLDAEQRIYVETISNSGNHLLAVVNDILDFSSIERGTLTLDADPLAIAELVELSDTAVRKAAADKRLEFRCEVAADVPELIIGDARRICQILINLLGNAVKFTSAGSVVLRIALAAAGDRRFLDFSVADTGIGISADILECLFEPFTQAESKKNRRFGGTGLGLAISKRLAEGMGGSITVNSQPDHGSTFTFHLPLKQFSGLPAAAAPVAVPSSPELALTSGGLVLVVEDDPTSRMVAGKMLQRLGYCTEFSADGAAAVEAFAPAKYVAILMDMAMPVMDGPAATRTIRELEAQSGTHVPIIALTANVMPGDRERCLAAGMDEFLSKPINWAELATMLARVLRQ